MGRSIHLAACSLALLLALPHVSRPALAEVAAAPSAPASSAEVRFGTPEVIRYRVGADITGRRGAVRDVLLMVAVPFECPEQDVRIVEEDISSGVSEVEYRDLQGGVRQMLIRIPYLPEATTEHALVTFEVTMRPILPPEKTDELKIPERVSGKLRQFTAASPYIEAKHRTIRNLASDILKKVDQQATDWEKVEALYDHVMDTVVYTPGPDKSALEAQRDEFADCQGRSALFVALCRASKIPARIVWVDGHVYAEFYLEDSAGAGHWYPIESAGTRAFGEMPLARPILQKGDNFRVPERPKDKLRYASDFMIALPTPGSSKPRTNFIHEKLN